MTPITNYTMCAEAADALGQSFSGYSVVVDGKCVWCRCTANIKFSNSAGYIPEQSKYICKKLPPEPPTCCSCENGYTFKTDNDGQPLNTNISKVLPIDCDTRTLPIQVLEYEQGYAARELSITTGGYSELFLIPFSRTAPPYKSLSACGISPEDWITYCIMLVDATYYVVRIDKEKVEFVAKLKSDVPGTYSAAAFGPSGAFYYTNSQSPVTVYTQKGLQLMQGYPTQNDAGLADLTQAQGSSYTGWNHVADVVAISADLDRTGSAVEYVVAFTGENVYVVKAVGAETQYNSWSLLATSGYHDGWGAGWSFNGTIQFANNKGLGVYEIPLSALDLNAGLPVEVKRVSNSEKNYKNNGMNCINVISPWLTPCLQQGYREVPATKYGMCPDGAKPIWEIIPDMTSPAPQLF